MPNILSFFEIYQGQINTDMADEINLPKETPANAATRIYDGIEQGIEDITTDSFGDNFVKALRSDPKIVEKDIGDYIHKMPENFLE